MSKRFLSIFKAIAKPARIRFGRRGLRFDTQRLVHGRDGRLCRLVGRRSCRPGGPKTENRGRGGRLQGQDLPREKKAPARKRPTPRLRRKRPTKNRTRAARPRRRRKIGLQVDIQICTADSGPAAPAPTCRQRDRDRRIPDADRHRSHPAVGSGRGSVSRRDGRDARAAARSGSDPSDLPGAVSARPGYADLG